MEVTILFLAVLAAIATWWLMQQRLTAKPWMEEGILGDFDGTGAMSAPAAKIGLGMFLAVVGTLFALLVSAYFMRMEFADWRSLRIPHLLWANTSALVLASIALQGAYSAAQGRNLAAVRTRLALAALFGFLFLVGQLWAWRQLTASGFFLASNPANSFFYLITGLHGLHVLGGLGALGWNVDKAWHADTTAKLPFSIEMCTIYWHFLLIVWLVLFALMTGLADDIGAICRQLLS